MTSNIDQKPAIEEQKTDEHAGQFYCGLCGWVDISEYASHGHGKEEK